jgi:hypothetical protein
MATCRVVAWRSARRAPVKRPARHQRTRPPETSNLSAPDSHALDLDILPPPTGHPITAALASPESAKDAQRALDDSFKAYRTRVDEARKALSKAAKAYSSGLERARKAATDAATPAKIASIGFVRSVTLTETTIKTPKGEYALTPEVTARAEQHGNKQVVQGWVFKSDNDRREVYLNIDGPTWAEVVPFSMKHSASQPRDLHEFASKVNTAARNVEASRTAIAKRKAAADRQHEQALRARSDVQQAAERVLGATRDQGDLSAAAESAEAFLATANPSDRKVRKLTESLQDIREAARARAAEAVETSERVRQETAAANAEADRIGSDRGTAAIEPQPSPVVAASESSTVLEAQTSDAAAPSDGPDVFEQIRKLGELRDAGFVSAEEFDAKKADLLSRL